MLCRRIKPTQFWGESTLDDRAGVRGNTRPEVSALLGDRASDGTALHLALRVDNDTGVVLEVEEQTVTTAPRLALADNNGRNDCALDVH